MKSRTNCSQVVRTRSNARFCRLRKHHNHDKQEEGSLDTDLDMHPPRLLTGRHGPGLGIIKKLRILAQAPPQTKLLAGIVTLVDQVALVGISLMTLC